MTAIPQLTAQRAEYKAALGHLTYDNASVEDVTRAVGVQLSPSQYVAAITTVRLPCRRCCGTGRFVTGTLNGQPTGPGGDCYRCGGRGSQDAADGARNRTHDAAYMARACGF